MSAIPATTVTEDLYTRSTDEKQKAAGQQDRVDKDEFLQLLVTQMTHQDPLNPMENTEFMSQMAQLQSLEEQIETNKTLGGMRLENQVASGAALIGTYVTGLNARDWPVEGIVTSSRVKDGAASVVLESGESIPLDQIERVEGLLLEEG